MNVSTADLDPSPRVAARLRAELGAKMAVWAGLAIGICVPYFGLQRVDAFPVRRAPSTWLDDAVAFDPQWIWPYASIAVLVAVAPLCALTRDDLRRYATGLATLCVACFAVFLLLPVEGPWPAAAPDVALYRFIVSVDRPTNSLPSLHVGLVVYSLLYCDRMLSRGATARRLAWQRIAGGLWGVAILYSTLATKQHWALDLPPAILLAWGAYALAWRRAD